MSTRTSIPWRSTMRYASLVLAVLFAFATGTAWALFETDKKELLASAKISLGEAVRTAENAVEGKVVKAELEEEDGKTAFEVEIVDERGQKRDVYVDAQTGEVIKIEEE